MNRVVALAFSLPRPCARHFSMSQATYFKFDWNKLKKKQALFQANMETPVYYSKGTTDTALFVILSVLSIGSFFGSYYFVMQAKK